MCMLFSEKKNVFSFHDVFLGIRRIINYVKLDAPPTLRQWNLKTEALFSGLGLPSTPSNPSPKLEIFENARRTRGI